MAEYDEGMVEDRLVKDLEKADLRQDGTTPHPPSPPSPSCCSPFSPSPPSCCSPFSPSPQFQLACIKDQDLIPIEGFLLRIESLPASGESPLSSAVMAKPKDRDDGRRRTDLLVDIFGAKTEREC